MARMRQSIELGTYIPTPALKGALRTPKLVPVIKANSIEPAIMWCPIEEEPLKHLIKEIIPLEAIRYEVEPEVREKAN